MPQGEDVAHAGILAILFMEYPQTFYTDLNDLRLLGAFGEGCPKGLVIWAVMQLSHFLGYLPDHFFNSIH